MYDITHECKHISYDEIKKYLELNEECFSKNDLDFVEKFDDQLDNCEICGELFRGYTLLSLLTYEKPKDFVLQFMREITKIGEAVRGIFEISLWPPPIAAVLKDIEKKDDRDAKVIKFHKNNNDSTFEFELSEETMVLIDMPQELASNQKYELHLQNETSEERNSYPMEETLQGGMAAVTGTLHAGKYLAAVVRVS